MELGEGAEGFIKLAWQSLGGWEPLAQVELPRALGYSATREENTYLMSPGKNARKTDLAFINGLFFVKDPLQECFLIELKCESANNRAKFKDAVRKDIKKTKGDIKKE